MSAGVVDEEFCSVSVVFWAAEGTLSAGVLVDEELSCSVSVVVVVVSSRVTLGEESFTDFSRRVLVGSSGSSAMGLALGRT